MFSARFSKQCGLGWFATKSALFSSVSLTPQASSILRQFLRQAWWAWPHTPYSKRASHWLRDHYLTRLRTRPCILGGNIRRCILLVTSVWFRTLKRALLAAFRLTRSKASSQDFGPSAVTQNQVDSSPLWIACVCLRWISRFWEWLGRSWECWESGLGRAMLSQPLSSATLCDGCPCSPPYEAFLVIFSRHVSDTRFRVSYKLIAAPLPSLPLNSCGFPSNSTPPTNPVHSGSCAIPDRPNKPCR